MTIPASPILIAPRSVRRTLLQAWLYAPIIVLTCSVCALLIGARFASPNQIAPIDGSLATRSLSNFHDLEQSSDGMFRWSQPDAALFIDGFDGQTALLDMRLAAPGAGRPNGAAVALATTSQPLATVQVSPTWRRYHLLVPTSASSETALHLVTEPYHAAGDSRALGIALSDFSVRRLVGPRIPTPTRALFLLGLPLLIWLFLWRLGAAQLALGAGIAAALGIGAAAAAPETASYLLPTIGWPWLPFLPLGLVAVAPQLRMGIGWLTRSVRFLGIPVLVGIGGIGGLAALMALRVGGGWPWGALLLAAATLLVAALPATLPTSVVQQTRVSFMRRELLELLIITLVALALRLYQLGTQPFGLWRDEAKHGLIALQIWQDPTFRPIYVVQNADLPALIFYLMAPVVGSFGPHVWSVRLVPALLGALTPLALWWAIRPIVGRNGALIAAALLAWASWSLSMSRWAFPATLDQLLTLLAIGCFWRAFSQGPGVRGQESALDGLQEPCSRPEPERRVPPLARRFSAGATDTLNPRRATLLAAAGALCTGLALYGYHNGRVEVVAVVVVTLLRVVSQRGLLRQAVVPLLVAAVVGVIVVAPMAAFIASDYEGYVRRVAKVSIFQTEDAAIHTPLAKVVQNAGRYLGMWHVAGDFNGRQHAPHAPMVDPLVGLGMLIGLGLVLRYWRQANFAILAWLLFGIVPGLFSADAPHAMRSLGALAPTCALAGLALAGLLGQEPAANSPALKRRGHTATYLVGAVLAGSLAFNGWLYFGQMANDPRVYGQFGGASTMMAVVAAAPSNTANPALQSVQVFVPSWLPDEDEARFLTAGQPLATFDNGVFSQPAGEQAIILVPSDQPAQGVAALQALGPTARQAATLNFPGSDQPVFFAYVKGQAAAQLLRDALESK